MNTRIYIAGPGTGKTYNLVKTVTDLLTNGENPADILVLTYTKKAVKEIKERLSQTLQILPEISTFHGLAYSLLVTNSDKTLQIASEFQTQILLNELMQKYSLDKKQNHSSLKQQISIAKNMLQTNELVKNYDSIAKQYNLLQFDDLLVEAVNQINTGLIQKAYKHILVDEFQDTSKIQLELLKLILANQGQVYAFGDPLQSIYSFRGANFDAFADLASLSENAEQTVLRDNYRSRQNILDLAHALFPQAPELKAVRAGNAEILLIETSSEYSQAYFIVNNIEQGIAGFDLTSDKINHSHNSNASNTFKDYAIIFRTNQQSEILKKILLQNNIPFQTAGEDNLFTNPKIKLIVALLHFLQYQDYQQLFAALPKAAFGSTYNLSMLNPTASANSLLKDKYQGRLEALINSNSTDVKNLIDFIVADWDLTVYFTTHADIWQEFNNLILNSPSLPDLLIQITDLIENNNYDAQAEKVTLITMHSVKGLEFKHVYLCAFNEGLIPLQKAAAEGQITEEKRLLYVALTRAKDSLTLFYLKNLGLISSFYEDLKPLLPIMPDELALQYERKKQREKEKKSQIAML